ncbi:MAG: serine/threonine protein kinase [Deltaproteobacteria bacterium]|nr:serine/threonine protein kinase [Deltaproteobacteria bacterium]
MLGDRVGAYRLLSKLGEGGMGVVYVGEHVELGQRVAVKLLLPELSQDQEIVQRFFNEARAATRIKHPGIVQVMDFGRHASGAAYFAMELLEGEALSARIRRVRMLGVQQVAVLGRQACNALAAAHAQGIVHRDLKPDNLMLVPDPDVVGGERVKILDFGIAKLAAEAQGVSLKTKTGSVMGTPYYMSPEQCRGAGEVDWRSDIYSMGCILYEMACGTPPFRGEGFGEVVGQHQFVAPVPPRQMASHVTPQLEAIILRALAKQAGERQQSMQELGNELAALAGPGMLSAPVPVPRVTEPEPVAAMAGMAMGSRRGGSSAGLGVATTMGSAAGQQLAAAAPGVAMGQLGAGQAHAAPRSKAPLFALLGLVLVGGGVATYFATRGSDEEGPGPSVSQLAAPSLAASPSPSVATTPGPTPASKAGAPRASTPPELAQAEQALAEERWSDALGLATQALRAAPGEPAAEAARSRAERELRAEVLFGQLEKQARARDWVGVLETYKDLDPASVYRGKASAAREEARKNHLATTLRDLGRQAKAHRCGDASATAKQAGLLLPDDVAALDKAVAACDAQTEGRMGNRDAVPKDADPDPRSSPQPSSRPGGTDQVACLIDPDLPGCRDRRGTKVQPSPTGAGESDRLSRDDLKEGMAKVRGRVSACFAKYGVAGTVKVKVTIASSGKVTAATAQEPFAGTPTGTCAELAVKQATFRAFSDGPISVAFPFLLQ